MAKKKYHAAHTSMSKKAKAAVKVSSKTKCAGGTVKATIPKGTKVSIDSSCKTNDMYHISTAKYKGWVPKSSMTLLNASNASEIGENQKNKLSRNAKKDVKSTIKKLKKSKTGIASAQKCYIHDSTGIMGIPYGFINRTDYRFDEKKNKILFGRKFQEKILSKMPILLITPGTPQFTPDMSKNDIKNMVSGLLNTIKGSSKTPFNYLFKNKNLKYYQLRYNYSDYYKYVNAMLRYCSILLKIGGVKHPSSGKGGKRKNVPFKKFKWQNARNTRLKNTFNNNRYIAFYLDSETSVTETMSNSTTRSGLADTVDSVSSIAKELQFIAGPIAGAQIAQLNESDTKSEFDAKVDEISNKISKHIGFSKLISNIGEGVKTVAKGGHLVFPEIWDDSDFDRSYSVSLKLRTPDADRISWYLNILVPLIHLIALTAPRNVDQNSYRSPFIIRAFYKGIFTVDMGIIQSLSITKGKEGAWTIDGLPTEVDIQMDIKELYNSLSISSTTGYKFFRNSSLIDYLANMCGINIAEPDLSRLVDMYVTWTKNKFGDVLDNGFLAISDSINNIILGTYNNKLKV